MYKQIYAHVQNSDSIEIAIPVNELIEICRENVVGLFGFLDGDVALDSCRIGLTWQLHGSDLNQKNFNDTLVRSLIISLTTRRAFYKLRSETTDNIPPVGPQEKEPNKE